MSFRRLLVANRGEIALRILRAAQRLGLETVAVYSEADRAAPHVGAADQSVLLGGAPAGESYLNVEAVMAAVSRSGAEAVHPGYGFLSEHAELARRCEEAGIVFVGPPASAIAAMGNKDEARRLAAGLGVPVVPGRSAAEVEHLGSRSAEGLALPVLIKAVAGGGGKAIRVVRRPGELEELGAARREALALFGEDALILEQLVEGGRHIEVQVLADAFGHVVHLYDRDCSLQRRYQKVVEEAPPTGLAEEVRARLRDHVVQLATGIDYRNAGTVEFLVRGEEIFFLEMNTRLQVEHRITERVLGVDLVALQLQVAAGEPLPFCQADLVVRGHAIEARVYAEDPANGFLPQAGRARTVVWPPSVLVDEALRSGDPVSPYYDPMLAKIVAHGTMREEARRRLVAALDETVIVGVATNVGFLRRLLEAGDVVRGGVDTSWLESHLDELELDAAGDDLALIAAAWWLATSDEHADHPLDRRDGWRLLAPPAPFVLELFDDAGTHRLVVDVAAGIVAGDARRASVRTLRGAGETTGRAGETVGHPGELVGHAVETTGCAGEMVDLEVDGVAERFFVHVGRDSVTVGHHGEVASFDRARALRPDAVASSGGDVRAPVPGVVTAVAAAPGEAVSAGQVLATMESMKLEIALRAPIDGSLAELHVSVGDHVSLDQLVAVVEDAVEGMASAAEAP